MDDILERARTAPIGEDLEPASAVRRHAGRRRLRRQVGAAAVAAAVGVLGVGALSDFGRAPEPAAAPQVDLILSISGTDVPLSQAEGVFKVDGECLYFSGSVAVLPSGSELVGNELRIAGLTDSSVRLDEQVRVGGAEMELAWADVIDNLVPSDAQPALRRCAAAASTQTWTLIT